MIKTMRYQIVKPLDMDWDTFGEILRQLRYESFRIMNKTIQLCWEFDGFAADFKAATGKYPTGIELKEMCDYKGVDGYAYNELRKQYPDFNSANLGECIRQAARRWKNDKADVFSGRKSIPSYKQNSPIYLKADTLSVHEGDNGYVANISLLSKEKLKEYGRKVGGIPIALMVKDNTQRVIMNRLISGKYRLGGSKITYNKRKKKWFLNISYEFEPQGYELVSDNVMGVDLGISVVACMAFNNSPARYFIGGGEIEKFRRGVQARRKSVQRQGKWCGDGRRGHGRNTRIKPIELLSDKERQFRDTTNHKYSRFIVDMAIKHKCAVIQVEDLTGITDVENRFLRNWTYYDLQQKIEYKSEEAGIMVVKIKPDYTSQRCSDCGWVDRENRQNQAEFACVACGYKENADYNAAKNIATPGIEEIIAKTKVREKETVFA